MNTLDDVKRTLISLRISDPGTVTTVKKLDRDYSQLIGGPIPYRNFGYSNLNDFLLSLNDSFVIDGYGPNAIVNAQAHVGTSSSHIQRFVKVSKNRPAVRRQANQRGDQNIIFPRTSKPPAYQSPEPTVNYKTGPQPSSWTKESPEHDEWNPPPKPTYQSPEPTVNYKTGSQPVLQLPSCTKNSPEHDEWNPPPKTQPKEQPKEKIRLAIRFPKTKPVHLPPKKVEKSSDKAETFCSTVPEFKMPDRINESSVFAILVTDVKSVNDFRFQVCETNELPTLMAQMDMFYNKLSTTDHQVAAFKVGLYCACLADNVWYRGRITKVMSDQEAVEIVRFDVSMEPVVVAEHFVKYLTPDFGRLCQQLGRGRLYGVPTNDSESTQLFEQLVRNKIEFAQKVGDINGVAELVLIDTNGPEDFEVNMFLTTQGRAQIKV